jgi:hypothetical protein
VGAWDGEIAMEGCWLLLPIFSTARELASFLFSTQVLGVFSCNSERKMS